MDELAFIDIAATPAGRGPDSMPSKQIAGEAFMPMAYGGGITTFDQVQRILSLGFEKVIFNSATFDHPQIAQRYGSGLRGPVGRGVPGRAQDPPWRLRAEFALSGKEATGSPSSSTLRGSRRSAPVSC